MSNKAGSKEAQMRSLIDRSLNIMSVMLIAFAVYLLACGATVKKMTGAFAACMQADLGQLVTPPPDTKTLLDDVAWLIAQNTQTLEADLEALALKVTADAVMCAIAAVDAVYAGTDQANAAAQGSAIAPNAAQRPPGLVRAKAWAAKHGGAS